MFGSFVDVVDWGELWSTTVDHGQPQLTTVDHGQPQPTKHNWDVHWDVSGAILQQIDVRHASGGWTTERTMQPNWGKSSPKLILGSAIWG